MRWAVTPLVVLLAAATPARADVWSDFATSQRAVVQLEDGRAQVEAHRTALERQSQALAADIERLKAEPAGVRRDLRLQEQLAAQKAKSDELERVAFDLRGRTSMLAGARRKLIADCDRLLATSLSEAKRLELARLRAAQATLLASPDRPLGVARANADPLDGPRELQDKADLLRDSGDKLRREAQRLAQRIDSVERRRHLRERAGAIDEDLFGEAVSSRRSRSNSVGNIAAGGASQTPSGPSGGAGGAPGTGSGMGGTASPPPGAGGAPTGGTPGSGTTTGGSSGGGTTTGGSPGGGGTSSPPPSNNGSGTTGDSGSGSGSSLGSSGSTGAAATVLRDLVDPTTLDELRRSDGGDDLDRQLRALRRAQGELDNLAKELDRRARDLSTRADELKHRK